MNAGMNIKHKYFFHGTYCVKIVIIFYITLTLFVLGSGADWRLKIIFNNIWKSFAYTQTSFLSFDYGF